MVCIYTYKLTKIKSFLTNFQIVFGLTFNLYSEQLFIQLTFVTNG